MSRLTRIIAPLLARAGLDVRTINGADGQVRELVVTNSRQPGWGRVVIDREGLMQWGYWGQVHDDHGATDIATVVIAIMATRLDSDPDRHGQGARITVPEERSLPQPSAPPVKDR